MRQKIGLRACGDTAGVEPKKLTRRVRDRQIGQSALPPSANGFGTWAIRVRTGALSCETGIEGLTMVLVAQTMNLTDLQL